MIISEVTSKVKITSLSKLLVEVNFLAAHNSSVTDGSVLFVCVKKRFDVKGLFPTKERESDTDNKY